MMYRVVAAGKPKIKNGGGDGDDYTLDDKDFEKRYGGKLNKSGDLGTIGSVKSTGKAGTVVPSTKVADKKAAPAEKPKAPSNIYEAGLKGSDIRNIN